MSTAALTEAGAEMLNKILNFWPPIIHQRKKDRIMRLLSLLMGEQQVSEAGPALVVEAAKFVVPKSYDPLFHMWEDPSIFERFLNTFESLEAYNAIPIQVRRWPPTRKKPAKPPEQMRVIAFCASPRKHGNTSLLIDEALKGVHSTGARGEKVMLQQIKMSYCIGCRRCKDSDYDGMCIIKDDMTELCGKIIEADAVIVGFPIYTGRECAQLSTFLDRWDCFERFKLKARLAPGRRALVIGTWGYDHIDTYDHVIENIMSVLNLHKVETVEAISACGFEGMLHGLDESKTGVIARYPEELKKAFDAGVGLIADKK
jgi:multimeric flavodoxin WrbA